MARPAGLEPATVRLEGECSIQLSYGRFVFLQEYLVGVEGFEPPTSCSQSRRATRLRYTPAACCTGYRLISGGTAQIGDNTQAMNTRQ